MSATLCRQYEEIQQITATRDSQIHSSLGSFGSAQELAAPMSVGSLSCATPVAFPAVRGFTRHNFKANCQSCGFTSKFSSGFLNCSPRTHWIKALLNDVAKVPFVWKNDGRLKFSWSKSWYSNFGLTGAMNALAETMTTSILGS